MIKKLNLKASRMELNNACVSDIQSDRSQD